MYDTVTSSGPTSLSVFHEYPRYPGYSFSLGFSFYVDVWCKHISLFQIHANNKRISLWIHNTNIDRLHMEPRFVKGKAKIRNLARNLPKIKTQQKRVPEFSWSSLNSDLEAGRRCSRLTKRLPVSSPTISSLLDGSFSVIILWAHQVMVNKQGTSYPFCFLSSSHLFSPFCCHTACRPSFRLTLVTA